MDGPWDFPGKNTGMGSHFLLRGIFPTQGSETCISSFTTEPARKSRYHRQLKPESHNYWVHAPGPKSRNYWNSWSRTRACALQQERPLQWEACTQQPRPSTAKSKCKCKYECFLLAPLWISCVWGVHTSLQRPGYIKKQNCWVEGHEPCWLPPYCSPKRLSQFTFPCLHVFTNIV